MNTSATDPLLQPLKIKHLVLKNRVMSTSHAAGLGDDSMPGERYQRYHEEKAIGGLALTMFGGSTNVAADSPNTFGQLQVDDDRVIPYFQSFAERIHKHNTALMCQITHLGRRGDSLTHHWLPTVAPSVLRETLHRSVPREMDKHDIQRIVKAFGEAARRCYEGGLDGLETHAGSHLIGQFFSPEVNRRSDEFGGSIENRARFALMVHEEIRRQTGDNFIIGMRMSMEEDRDGLPADEALKIAELLEREGAIDFLNCVFGRMDTELSLAEKNMPGMTQPIAPFLERMSGVKQAVTVPLFHAARIVDIATARHAIRDRLLDMVAMTRAHIADPHIVNKIQRGEEHRIRPCFGASHCMHVRPSCIHNVASGREVNLPHVIQKVDGPERHIVVVGAGPAGLEAARVAAERGHHVTLLEAADRPGGQVLLAAEAGWRHDLKSIVDWRVAELEHLRVEVRYNTFAEAGDIAALNADVVVLATGGLPNVGSQPGDGLCVTTWDILGRDVQAAERVLVVDGTGRHEASSCAQFLADKSAQVTLATIDDRACAELGYAERVTHRKALYTKGIELKTDVALLSVHQQGNALVASMRNDLTDEPVTIETDQVVIERGTIPADEIFQELRHRSVNDGVTDIDALLGGRQQPSVESAGKFELYRVGDAVASRSLHAALLDAYRLCVNL